MGSIPEGEKVTATAPAGITKRLARAILYDDMDALIGCYEAMSNEKKREFWQLRGPIAEKILFLLKWGAFAEGRPVRLSGPDKAGLTIVG